MCTWVHVCECVCFCVCVHMRVDMDRDREMEQNPGPRYMPHAVTVSSVNLILQNRLEDKALGMSACWGKVYAELPEGTRPP